MTKEDAFRMLWFILKSNDGYTIEKADMEDYPGDDKAVIGVMPQEDGSLMMAASTAN